MAKIKPKAKMMVAHAAGGLAPVEDRRFDTGAWPIEFLIAKEQANTWLQYLSAECGKRGGSCAGMSQLERNENSGSLTINTSASGQPQLAVVWERKRNGAMKVRARSTGSPEYPLTEARELFEKVNESCSAGIKERFHRQCQLCYQGLPWCGGLWLGDSLRLSKPSRQDDTALIGPRIILVDAQIDAIDAFDANWAFQLMLEELSVFLSVVIGIEIQVSANAGRRWTWINNSSGQVECDIRNLGYCEKEWSKQMPTRGEIRQVPFQTVVRPDFSLRGIDGSQTELHPPSDIQDLWGAFTALPSGRRRQFLQVGSMWQMALSVWRNKQTAAFAWMVAACEALKPPESLFKDHNIYNVVEALLGKATRDLLQEEWFRPQIIRSVHFHSGEFRGSEFVQHIPMSSFQDPTFDHARRELARITQAAIIEWLRIGDSFTMPPLKQRKGWRRLMKDHILLVLWISMGVGMALGLLLAWLFGFLAK